MSKNSDVNITFDDGNHKVIVNIFEMNDKQVKVKLDLSDCPDDYEGYMIGMVNWFVRTITKPDA